MKRVAGIFLLSLYLFAYTEVHNLLKLPVLFVHFQEHKQQQPGISFYSFIKIHYLGPIEKDEDYQRDQQLPFRDASCSVMIGAGVCECHQPMMEMIVPVTNPRQFGSYREANKPQSIAYEFFQPPRAVCA
jgi:hypothetical protein